MLQYYDTNPQYVGYMNYYRLQYYDTNPQYVGCINCYRLQYYDTNPQYVGCINYYRLQYYDNNPPVCRIYAIGCNTMTLTLSIGCMNIYAAIL